MRVNQDFNSGAQNPKQMFPSNSSFTFYTNPAPFNTPYVVAEISSANYQMARRFVVGSNESNSFNDDSKYVNGPLTSDTRYTVFVWGFSPVPQVRQTKICWWACPLQDLF